MDTDHGNKAAGYAAAAATGGVQDEIEPPPSPPQPPQLPPHHGPVTLHHSALHAMVITLYFSIASSMFLLLLHVSAYHCPFLQTVSLAAVFFWLVVESLCFAHRSIIGSRGLVVWFAWFSLLSTFDLHWILRQPEFHVCFRPDSRLPGGGELLWLGLPGNGSDGHENGTALATMSSSGRHLTDEEFARIPEEIGGAVALCIASADDNNNDNSQWLRGSMPYNGWLYRASVLVMLGVALKSCAEYYWTRSSHYLYTHLLVCGAVIALVPKPRPPNLGDTWLLYACSIVFFWLHAISTRCITARTQAAGLRNGKWDDNPGEKEEKIQTAERLELCRLVQCAWVLFAWEWWMLPAGVGVQCYLYYKIYKSSKAVHSEPRRQRRPKQARTEMNGTLVDAKDADASVTRGESGHAAATGPEQQGFDGAGARAGLGTINRVTFGDLCKSGRL